MKIPSSTSSLFLATLAISSSSSALAAPAGDIPNSDATLTSSPSNHHVTARRDSTAGRSLRPKDMQQLIEAARAAGDHDLEERDLDILKDVLGLVCSILPLPHLCPSDPSKASGKQAMFEAQPGSMSKQDVISAFQAAIDLVKAEGDEDEASNPSSPDDARVDDGEDQTGGDGDNDNDGSDQSGAGPDPEADPSSDSASSDADPSSDSTSPDAPSSSSAAPASPSLSANPPSPPDMTVTPPTPDPAVPVRRDASSLPVPGVITSNAVAQGPNTVKIVTNVVDVASQEAGTIAGAVRRRPLPMPMPMRRWTSRGFHVRQRAPQTLDSAPVKPEAPAAPQAPVPVQSLTLPVEPPTPSVAPATPSVEPPTLPVEPSTTLPAQPPVQPAAAQSFSEAGLPVVVGVPSAIDGDVPGPVGSAPGTVASAPVGNTVGIGAGAAKGVAGTGTGTAGGVVGGGTATVGGAAGNTVGTVEPDAPFPVGNTVGTGAGAAKGVAGTGTGTVGSVAGGGAATIGGAAADAAGTVIQQA